MKNKISQIENDDIFNNIEFNKNEIRTEENFFNEINSKNTDEDISLDFDKSEDSLTSDKLELSDKSMEEQMSKVTLNDQNNSKQIKKITKEDLKIIPLPLFECLFCADEELSFRHLSNEILSKKYLYNAEKKDLILIDFLINNNILKFEENDDDILKNFGIKNNIDFYRLKSLVHTISKNTEYINKYYNIEQSSLFLKQKRNREKNKKSLNSKINKEKLKFNINLDFNEGKYGNDKMEIFNEDKIDNKIKSNDNIKEDKENDVNCGFIRMLNANCFWDLSRKIKKEDIIFEDKPYNIWDANNNIDDSLENDF